MWRNMSFVAGVCVLVSASLFAGIQEVTTQEPVRTIQPTAPAPLFVNLTKVSNDYQVGAGDVLDIQVIGHSELNQVLRVSNTGDVSFPLLGLVRVAGLNAFEIEAAITATLRDRQLVNEPEVLVYIREYKAKPVYVSGAVVNPGEFVMAQELTLSEAILLAGGLLVNAADEGLVHRRTSAAMGNPGHANIADQIETLKVDLRPMKQGQFTQAALSLRAGDVIVIPEMRMNTFYVVGDVWEPSNYLYAPGKTLMVSQALSWAKGPTPTAKMSDGMLVRFHSDGSRTEKRVDYAAILRGEQQDFLIEPNDIIFVPGSKVKTITNGLLLLTDTMVMQQTFRIARTYQAPDPPERPVREPR